MHAYPTYPTNPATRPRMNPWNWVLLIAGVILSAVGLGLAIAGTFLMMTNAGQRDGQYLTLEAQRYESIGHAIISPPIVFDEVPADSPERPPLEDIASFQVRATPVIPNQELFIGVADTSDVETYLSDVPHAIFENTDWSHDRGPDQWSEAPDARLQEIGGVEAPAPPGEQDFWAESVSGAGTQELTFDLQQGQWTLVVMNADGSRPVWVDLEAGARTELLGPIGPGLLIAGLITLVVGIPLLLFGAAGLGRDIDRPLPTTVPEPAAVGGIVAYPLSLSGHLGWPLSRWLWLVKWLLVIPHLIVLAVLSFAQLITTIAAGFAILFTGRYPRPWFVFSVGVLRWSWRVGFYAYLALGTDRYPPFTLADADYPAGLTVPYPQRLSRGLVLVKWWLLVLPHVLILGVLAGGGGLIGIDIIRSTTVWTFSLLGLLVLIAAIALLFTGHYLPGVFPLVIGINRWAFRVSTYAFLLRDEYPPFRLDQGPTDPPPRPLSDEGSPQPNT